LEPVVHQARVFEKVFLDLQEDEIAFTNPQFQKVYQRLMNHYTQDTNFSLDTFVNSLGPEEVSEVTHILMDEEQYVLHDWDRMNIFVKDKKAEIARLVNETILALRRHLVSQKIMELTEMLKSKEIVETSGLLQEVMDYNSLRRVLSEKLNRVL